MKEKDSRFEGRDDLFMDVDRMINEGLAGGMVYSAADNTNIEEARDLIRETPPNQN
ncbi:hypothetical protein [Bacillus benzoevorans]|uniref:Uncharacterized protein n=1 Tax=Bacillus benzoevorans TaxID=1456 RepID=A0A7X0LTI9_9BACI|nr:hypothetical protein [Bacillus benzoevorans]MBB6443455.1 hypothetical protein [Bacillus benzoevorans]